MRPGREALDLLPGAGFTLSRVETRRVGGILERPQHAGHIPQGRVLELAFTHQLLRLPLEVKNNQIVAGIEYLAQMIVAVTADAPGRSEEHTSELQSQSNLVCRLLLEK